MHKTRQPVCFPASVWWPQLSFQIAVLETSNVFQEFQRPKSNPDMPAGNWRDGLKMQLQFSQHIICKQAILYSSWDFCFSLSSFCLYSVSLFLKFCQRLTLWEADEPQEVQQLDWGEHQHHDAHRLQPLRLPDRAQHCSALGPLHATIPWPVPGARARAGLLALGTAARTSAPTRPCTPVPLHPLQRYTGPHARAGRLLAPAYCPFAP